MHSHWQVLSQWQVEPGSGKWDHLPVAALLAQPSSMQCLLAVITLTLQTPDTKCVSKLTMFTHGMGCCVLSLQVAEHKEVQQAAVAAKAADLAAAVADVEAHVQEQAAKAEAAKRAASKVKVERQQQVGMPTSGATIC